MKYIFLIFILLISFQTKADVVNDFFKSKCISEFDYLSFKIEGYRNQNVWTPGEDEEMRKQIKLKYGLVPDGFDDSGECQIAQELITWKYEDIPEPGKGQCGGGYWGGYITIAANDNVLFDKVPFGGDNSWVCAGSPFQEIIISSYKSHDYTIGLIGYFTLKKSLGPNIYEIRWPIKGAGSNSIIDICDNYDGECELNEIQFDTDSLNTLGTKIKKYVGETKGMIPHGKGILTYPGGLTYDGEWKNGLPNGALTQSNTGIVYYKGTWKDGEYHGFGIAGTYEGEFKNGQRHGIGKETGLSGGTETYEGEWKNDTMTGKGKFTKDGTTIVAEWNDYEGLDCKGSIIFSDGYKYTGDLKGVTSWFPTHIAEGKGKLLFPNGDYYIGEFKDNYMHGEGKLTLEDVTASVIMEKNEVVKMWAE